MGQRMMEVVVEEYEQLEGWVLQMNGRERMGIQDLEEEFHEGLRGLQERETGLIPGGVDVG